MGLEAAAKAGPSGGGPWTGDRRSARQAAAGPQMTEGAAVHGATLAAGYDSWLVRAAVRRAQQGDMGAIHFLYVRYAKDVLRCVRGLVRDHHEAEDITHEVFVKLIRVIGKYEPREVPFAAWILRVARNAALDHLRSRRAIPCEELRLQDDAVDQDAHQRRRDLRQALGQLPPEQRQVLILRHIVGLSPVEIAELLGKTESSVHGLHHRGRASLRSALRELDATPVVSADPDSPGDPPDDPEGTLLQAVLPERARPPLANS
jgi:RNA polymerase sigma-70 factor, ECF subfamily